MILQINSKVSDLPKIFFHGTIDIHGTSLNDGIDVSKGREATDFWTGFYVTSNPGQAFEWAKDVYDRYAKRYLLLSKRNPANIETLVNPKKISPLVLAYELDKNILLKTSGKIFNPKIPDADWACFVFNNRKRKKSSFHKTSRGAYQECSICNLDMEYNYVYGAIADRGLDDALSKLENEEYTFDRFMSSIKVQNTDQLSFHNNVLANEALISLGEVVSREAAQNIIRKYGK